MDRTADPSRPPPSDTLTILTIGHSNHPITRFCELLQMHGVALLVDVRSQPYSRYAGQFNRDALEDALQSHGIGYEFLGDRLGGRPAEARFYDEAGRVRYGAMAESEPFREGLERLVNLAGQARTAIMCGEGDPTECHRRLLVGRALEREGVQIVHILPDGSTQSEQELKAREAGGQASLFEEEGEWLSTRSVSRRSPRSSSSASSAEPESDDSWMYD
ncbi:MAG: hypothetical protein AMXMBFR61_24630 [Fimbriimonadales bacterium]